MSRDPFASVERVLVRSVAARWFAAGRDALVAAWRTSLTLRFVVLATKRIGEAGPTTTVTAVGASALTAVVTSFVVASTMPREMRPLIPTAGWVAAGGLALIVIIAAAPVARAWPRSKFRRLLLLTR